MLGAVFFSALAVACGGDLNAESNGPNLDGPNLDATSGGSPPVEASPADSNVQGLGADASDSGDGPRSGAATGGNLIVNPSCDNGTFDWTTVTGTPLSSSAAFAHTGDIHSCYSSMRTDGYAETNYPQSSYDGPLQDVTAVVSGGHEYSFSAWVLWAPPGAVPLLDASAGDDAAVANAGPDGTIADAMAGGDAADASEDSAANEAGTTYPPEQVYVTAKETCTGVVNYIEFAAATGVPEAQWTQLTTSGGGLMVPENCTQIQIYIAGPNVGMDLYADEVTLLFVQ